MFSDEDVRQCETPNVGSDVVRAIMVKTAELLAARGAALGKWELAELDERCAGTFAETIRSAFAAQGARVAVLERERDDWHEMVDEKERANESLTARLHSAEESVRELTRRAQQAEGMVESLRRTVKEERLAYRNLSTERDMLKARCATLSAAGQVLSAHVDKDPAPEYADGICGPRPFSSSVVCIMPRGHDGDHWDGTEVETIRYPCSPTCTHDDAATPGHPERVKHRSEAVKALSEKILPGPDVIDGGPGSRGPVRVVSSGARDMAYAYAEGAEAMRAACLEAVQERMRFLGITEKDAMWSLVKSAVEGAAP